MPNDMTSDHDAARAADRPIVPAAGPTIRELTRAECDEVLRRNVVGRVAFAFDRRVEIRPIHYVYEDGWLYAAGDGRQVEMWRHAVGGVRVDEVHACSTGGVLVHGGLYLVTPDTTEADAATWERAVQLLRRLVPEAGTAYDPTPERTLVFRIHADDVTGRTATPPPVA